MTADPPPETPDPPSRERVDARDAADVDALVRLAVDSVHRLVSDAWLAEEIVRSIPADRDDPVARLLAAQRVLARVLAYEQATLDSAFTAEEVEDLLRRSRLDAEEAQRLLYELSLGGGRSWPAILLARQLAKPPLDEPLDLDKDPWLAALRLLVAGEAATGASRQVRRSVEQVRSQPLGFARLALEVADAASIPLLSSAAGDTVETSPLAQVHALLDDPFLRRESAQHLSELLARCAVYRADAARRRGRLEDSVRRLRSARQRLAAGSGDPRLRALVEEGEAGVALASGDLREALRRQSAAVELLEGLPGEEARHRRIEARLKRALMLARDASRRHEAGKLLAALAESLDESIDSAEDEVDSALRLRVLLADARVELDLARQTVAEASPLGRENEAEPAEALASYARAWSRQSPRLERAADVLRSAEFWLDAGDEHDRAEHQWLGGLGLLLENRRRAAEALRSALVRFRRLGDEAVVEQISIDLIVCGVLAGTLGDEVEDGSAPLELFRRLAARTQTG